MIPLAVGRYPGVVSLNCLDIIMEPINVAAVYDVYDRRF